MMTIDEYRAGFCDEEKEIVVYISKGFAGASMLQDCYVVKSVFVAMMDPQDGKLTECDGRIEQVVSKDEYEQGEFITIEDNMIVKLAASESIPEEPAPGASSSIKNRYLVRRLITSYKLAIAPEKLLEFRDMFLDENMCTIDGINYHLNRAERRYKGVVLIRGCNVEVKLCLDEDSDSGATTANARLHHVLENMDRFALAIKTGFTKEFLTEVNRWKEDEDDPDLSPDGFMEMIFLKRLVFDADGSVEFHYTDGDLFAGATLIARFDGNDLFVGCDIKE